MYHIKTFISILQENRTKIPLYGQGNIQFYAPISPFPVARAKIAEGEKLEAIENQVKNKEFPGTEYLLDDAIEDNELASKLARNNFRQHRTTNSLRLCMPYA